jgi:hypothetical protein
LNSGPPFAVNEKATVAGGPKGITMPSQSNARKPGVQGVAP